jgi:hypothetical protein
MDEDFEEDEADDGAKEEESEEEEPRSSKYQRRSSRLKSKPAFAFDTLDSEEEEEDEDTKEPRPAGVVLAGVSRVEIETILSCARRPRGEFRALMQVSPIRVLGSFVC